MVRRKQIFPPNDSNPSSSQATFSSSADIPIPATSQSIHSNNNFPSSSQISLANTENENKRNTNKRKSLIIDLDDDDNIDNLNEIMNRNQFERNEINRKSQQKKRKNMTPEESEIERMVDRERHAKRRDGLTDQEKELEKIIDRDNHIKIRSNLSEEVRDRERSQARIRMEGLRINRHNEQWDSFYKKAADRNSAKFYQLGDFNIMCNHCNAPHFPEESIESKEIGEFNDCCKYGNLTNLFSLIDDYPVEMKVLFDPNEPNHKNFMENIRRLNSSFSCASLACNRFTLPGHGPPVFKIHGQIYHKFNEFAEPINNLPTNGQLYFVDTDESINVRSKKLDCDKFLLERIENCLREHYIYAESYKYLKDIVEEVEREYQGKDDPIPDVKLLFSLKKGFDKNRYNLPISNEIYAIMVTNADGEVPAANIVVHHKGDKYLTNLYPLDSNVEGMTYALLYPNKSKGWQYGMKDKKGKNISLCDFVKFKLYYREEPYIPHHNAGKLFQQWTVDQAAKIEWDRLQYIRTHQKEIKKMNYKALDEYLRNIANKKGMDIGKQVILPSSFTGGPRSMEEHFFDAMTIVGEVGKPDLFLTFTMNPNDPDILKTLKPGQTANDRPDIVSRVFNLKRERMIDYIIKGRIFGVVIGYCWVVEFQKRGLPHMHMLMTLHPDDKMRNKDVIDKFISGEIPDKDKDPELYQLVTQFMIHGPCDVNSRCWNHEKNKCSKKFPKKFSSETLLTDDGYTTYKRPNNGRFVYRKNKRLTNEHVVPYNPWLLVTFRSHINVERVSDIKAVKYIYKYIYKGYDAAIIEAVMQTANGDKKILNYDEISNYLDGRCISPIEACMRIFKFPLQGKSHSIVKLDVHLEGEQNIYIDENAEEDEIEEKMDKKSKLLAYFKFVQEHPELDILYPQMPKYCTWIPKEGKWKYPRAKQSKKCLGRMFTVSPKNVELYYMRFLLLHFKFKSYIDMKTYDGIIYDTFAQVCCARGLTRNDEEWHDCLQEATRFRFPRAMRNLFVNILVHCQAKYPEELWLKFRDDIAHDLMRFYPTKEKAYNQALYLINQQLIGHDLSLSDFKKMPQLTGQEDKVSEDDVYDPKEERDKADKLISFMNNDQKTIINKVENSFKNTKRALIFIDGPGGTGKSYTLKTVFHLTRSYKKNVCNMAFSGIAATVLQQGRTVHNRFKLPLNLNNESTSGIEINSKDGNEIINTDVFVWDEAGMSPRHALDVVNKKLKELTKKNKSFGDKIILLSGDFRQCLPIMKNGNRSEIINLLIKNSPLFKEFETLHLTENLRADPHEKDFAEFLLKIGDGNTDNPDYFQVPNECLCEGDLIDEIFSDIFESKDYSLLPGRGILSPYNSEVDQYNCEILKRFPGNEETFLSIDESESTGDFNVPIEILNNMKCPGLPDHKIELKKDCIVMLLRNLNVRLGLCNGTRIQILDWGKNVLRGIILTGDKFGEEVLLPRITLIEEKMFPFILKRHQFPIKVSFSFTINKAQAQTFEKIGIDLTRDVFGHGQAYVALSRAKSWKGIKVKLPNGVKEIKNIVWKEAL